ncbi:hypothetical protein NU08_3008 [Flavobacterium anhuiense]|uniref:Uncharacterized protein n=1 Tax=Flavobacterium anhuiense TaxID=459526 RepID=A0A444VWZ6_9FLAO|nr:hypothetical protein NU08_3008 [Flavobacterium anhuiense]
MIHKTCPKNNKNSIFLIKEKNRFICKNERFFDIELILQL